MSLQQLFIIFIKRKNLIIAYLLVTMLATLAISLSMPKQYVANTSLVLDQPSINPITGANLPIQLTAGYMATQTDIIKSAGIARIVSQILDLTHNEDFQEDFRKSSKLKLEQYEVLQSALHETSQLKGDENLITLKNELIEDFNNWIIDDLSKNIDVAPSRESSILSLSFSSTDPKFAAKVANAYAQAYIQICSDLKRQSMQQTADWFEEQANIHKTRMEQAQEQLSGLQQKYGVIANFSEERVDLEESKLSEISIQLIRNQIETDNLIATKEQLNKIISTMDLKSLDNVLSSPVLQRLKGDLAFKEADFAEIKKNISYNHPSYIKAEAEIASLKRDILAEMKTELQNFNRKIEATKKRDQETIKKVEEQKKRVLELKKYYDEIIVRKREVENAKFMYDEVTRRAIQMRMESEIRQSNAAILNYASVPKVADKPKIKINMILSVFLGLILGLGAALFAEVIDRRVRSQADVINTLDLPVFGVIVADKPVKKFLGVNF